MLALLCMDSATPASASSASKKGFTGGYYKGGDSGFFQDDPRYRQIEQEEALRFLTTKDASWFYREYSGELAPSGYLLDKRGQETNTLPTQAIGAGIEDVEAAARERFRERYPDAANTYQEQEKTRIYSDPSSDPAHQEMDKAIRDGVKERMYNPNNFPPGMDDQERYNYALGKEQARAAESFVKNYPEKAKAYAKQTQGSDSSLNNALNKAVEEQKKSAAGSAARRLSEEQIKQSPQDQASENADRFRVPPTTSAPLSPAPIAPPSPRSSLNQATEPSGNRPKQQARMLGNLIGNQQADARMASLNGNGGGRSGSDSNYPPSVLDAMRSNKGVPPTESMYAEEEDDEGEDTESAASRNAAFQAEQRAGADNQAHFLQSGEGYDDEGSGDELIEPDAEDGYDEAAESAYEDAQPDDQPSSSYRSSPYAAQRLGGLLQQPTLDEEADEADDELEANAASLQVGTSESPLKEMAGREARFALAATGIGAPVALVWIVGKLGKNFFADADKKASPLETYRDLSEAGTIMLESVVGIFMVFLESLPIIVPIVLAVSGLALATQYFGPEIADLVTQLAN